MFEKISACGAPRLAPTAPEGAPSFATKCFKNVLKALFSVATLEIDKMAWFNLKTRREHLKKPPCGAFAKDGDLKSFKNLHLKAHVNII